jgi:hypothetical protein
MKYILIIIPFFFFNHLSAQEVNIPKSFIEINRLIEPNEPSYGYMGSYQRQIFYPKSYFVLHAGIFNSFLITDETVEREGTTGETFANQLGTMLTAEFRFLKNKNLFVSLSIHTGWGYRNTNVDLKYADYNIDRNYQESYHHLLLGQDARVGFRWKNKWGIQFFIRNDLSRLVDAHRNILGEKPAFIYGYGLTYSW